MHANPVTRRSKPRFARIIARRYQIYQFLALFGLFLLTPAVCFSAALMNRPIFALLFVVLSVICVALLVGVLRWRRRSIQAAIGERAELQAVDLVREALPNFICTENMAYWGGDMDLVLLNETERVVLVIEVKAYYNVDDRIDAALAQARRAAYAMKQRFQSAETPAYVVEGMQDIERVFPNTMIIVPLVVLPLSNRVSDNPFVFTRSNVTTLRSLVAQLRSSRGA